MSPKPLKMLIKEADAETLPANNGESLAERVFDRASQQRRASRWRAGVVASGVAVIVIAALVAWPGHQRQIARTPDDPKAIEQEISQRMRIVAELEQTERLMRWRIRSAEARAVDPVQQSLDSAAFAMVYQADRMDREMGLRAQAEQVYRQAAENFPQTHWGQVAMRRLSELGQMKG